MKTSKKYIVFITNLTRKKLYSIFVLRTGSPPGARLPVIKSARAGAFRGWLTGRRTLTIQYNLAASIGEVCRDYAKSSRPKENGEA